MLHIPVAIKVWYWFDARIELKLAILVLEKCIYYTIYDVLTLAILLILLFLFLLLTFVLSIISIIKQSSHVLPFLLLSKPFNFLENKRLLTLLWYLIVCDVWDGIKNSKLQVKLRKRIFFDIITFPYFRMYEVSRWATWTKNAYVIC